MKNKLKSYQIYDSVYFAKYLVARCNNEDGIDINKTKLQKLLYIVYGTMLSIYGRIVVDEMPKAWLYGPVFPKTVKRLDNKDFKSITFERFEELKELDKDEEVKNAVDVVLNRFGKLSAGQLTNWSHKEESPWWRVIKLDNCIWNTPIPNEYIKEYFDEIIRKY